MWEAGGTKDEMGAGVVGGDSKQVQRTVGVTDAVRYSKGCLNSGCGMIVCGEGV